jgi:hypothetical protein
MKDPKAKTFFSAFQALFTNDEVNDDDGNTCNDNIQDAPVNNEADEDLRGFLSMVGSLKE